jgi:hypothetical protein
MAEIRFPADAIDVFLPHSVQTSSWVHSAPYPMDIKGSFPEADHSPSFSYEVKNCGDIPPLHHTFLCFCAGLIKHGDNFALIFYFYPLLHLLIYLCFTPVLSITFVHFALSHVFLFSATDFYFCILLFSYYRFLYRYS